MRFAFVAIFVGAWLSAAVSFGEQEKIAAPPCDLGVPNVRLEMYGWEKPDRQWTPSPGLFAADGSLHDQLISGRYQIALAGNWPAGAREVFGFVGGPYPNEADFQVVRFARTNDDIEIVLKHLPTGGRGDGYRSWKVLYLSALLPLDLPNGQYTVRCTMLNADGQKESSGPSALQCQVLVSNPRELRRKAETEALKKLTDEQLVKAYIDAGRALGSSRVAPREIPVPDVAPYELGDVRYLRLREIGDEIVRRSASAVPSLLEALKRQIPADAANPGPYPFGFGHVVMEMLVKIGDPRPVPLLVRILAAPQSKASLPARKNALDALEQLTLITFRRQMLDDGRSRWAVEDPGALPPDPSDPIFGAAGPAGQARAFDDWLKQDGRDPAEWLALARRRARAALDGNDLRAVYAAADFLQSPGPDAARDDDPAATLRRLGTLLSRARQVGYENNHYEYQIDGDQLPLTMGQWSARLAFYKAQARPWAATLIRFDREMPLPSPARLADLNQIGGEEIVAYLVDRAPELDKRVGEAGLDLETDAAEISDPRQHRLLLSAQIARWALMRWTGQVFTDDQKIGPWWKTHQHQTQEQWMRQALQPLAQRADDGDARAQYLVRILVPQLPREGGESVWIPPTGGELPGSYWQPSQVFRAAWVRQNERRLSYDADAGSFELRQQPP